MPAGKRAARARRALTHVDERGAVRMVDVGAKPVTERRATARGMLVLSSETLALVRDGRAPKGDVLASARLAGIMAAKRTSITHASVDLVVGAKGIAIEATVATTAQTGVEMEALTAVTIAGLTLYDMLKAIERGARLTDVRLVAKSGGRSGEYRAR
jgi:cyclic pyranopterin phosphate synthase